MIHNKRRLMVYEKRVMHRINGLQGKEVRGRKRKIQTEALLNVYSLQNKVIK
jgi:predicted RNA-binding protein with EMAP domain